MTEQDWVGPADPAAENALDEFVDYWNARDLDGVADLLSAEASSEFFQGDGAESVIQGMSDFLLRHPTLVTTRGELDEEPVVAAWIPDPDREEYGLAGYFVFGFVGDYGEARIDGVEYVEEWDERLLVEEPEATEIPEWEDWSE